MRIAQDAIAGTLESSDVMVRVAPPPDGEDGLEIDVSSAVPFLNPMRRCACASAPSQTRARCQAAGP